MVNFVLVVDKIMKLKGLRSEKDVAKTLGISPQDFSNRKKRGTLLPVVVEWAINERVNLDWLLTGEELTEKRKASPVVKLIDQVLEDMDEETQREVLKYTEEKKLLGRLKRLVLDKEAGWVAINLVTLMIFPTLIILALVAYSQLSGPTALELLRQQPKWFFSFLACVAQNPIAFIELTRKRTMSWKVFQQ